MSRSPAPSGCCSPTPQAAPEPVASCCAPPSSPPSCCPPAPLEAAANSSCCASRSEKAEPALAQPQAVGWKAYTPLLVIVASTLLATAALQMASAERSAMLAMSQFMGLFLIVFAMLKLFDLPGFVNGFARYDLLAGPVRPYGYLYPFLELGFGLALLARLSPVATNAGLAVLMFFGAAGVLRALRRGETLRCACMGSSLNVPLSTVAVIEDVGMGIMSLGMLVALQ